MDLTGRDSEDTADGGSSVRQRRRFLWIDFLRGMSALAVTLHHLTSIGWLGMMHLGESGSSWFDRLCSLLAIPARFGGSCVVLFFIVSGFCIHYPQTAADKKLNLVVYARRRFLRIYPPYIAAIVFALVLVQIVAPANYAGSSVAQIIENVFMVQNYHAGSIAADPVLWSLPVEAELYLTYPLLLAIYLAKGIKIAVGGLVIISLIATVAGAFGWAAAAVNFLQYWLIWFSGAIVAQWVRVDDVPRVNRIAWSVLILASLAALSLSLSRIALGQVLCFAGAYFCVFWLGMSLPSRLKWLEDPVAQPFQLLGRISYSLYLVHYPVLLACAELYMRVFGAKPANFLVSLSFVPVCILTAYVFYKLIEEPSHKLARGGSSSGK